jgi:hypothetical protein
MIITTLYRDIPFDEARKCVRAPFNNMKYAQHWETEMRAKAVQIATPAVETDSRSYYVCNGPFYKLNEGTINSPEVGAARRIVCVHIAEIGD